MNMMTLNAESLSKQLGTEVDEVVVLIAKNDVAGLPAETIAELLGLEKHEIVEVQETQVYKDCRLLLGMQHSQGLVDKDFNWDAIEGMALSNLAKRVPFEKDTDMILKIAAVANRAQRRMAPVKQQVLDPGSAGQKVALQLTSRITQKLAANGDRSQIEERQISVMDGSATNPTFKDIDSLLGVSRQPRIAEKMAVTHMDADFTVEDILKDMS